MIASWMIYSTLVAALFAIVAGLLERVLRARGLQARLLWLFAIVASLTFTASVAWRSTSAVVAGKVEVAPASYVITTHLSDAGVFTDASPAVPAAPTTQEPGSTPGDRVNTIAASIRNGADALLGGAALRGLDRPLAVVWFASTLVVFGLVIGSMVRIRSRRSGWRPAALGTTPVLVTDGVGPAVVGVVESAIAVPEWVLELHPDQQKLIIEHERQHQLARDPLLMISALGCVALLPFNAFMWVMLRALRRSTEMDCDSRVLRALPAPRAYASLLVDIGSRALPHASMSHALADNASDLEHRVRDILVGRRALRHSALGARVGASALLVAVACAAPSPRVETEPEAAPAVAVMPPLPGEVGTPAQTAVATPRTASATTTPGAAASATVVPAPTALALAPQSATSPLARPGEARASVSAAQAVSPAPGARDSVGSTRAVRVVPPDPGVGAQSAPRPASAATTMGTATPRGAVASAGQAVTAQDSGTYVLGSVSDSANRRLLSAVAVQLVGTRYTATSDAQGTFAIARVPPGTYTLRATRVGYAPITRDSVVVGRTPVVVDFLLPARALRLEPNLSGGGRGGRAMRDTAASSRPGAVSVLTGSAPPRGGRGGAAASAGGFGGRGGAAAPPPRSILDSAQAGRMGGGQGAGGRPTRPPTAARGGALSASAARDSARAAALRTPPAALDSALRARSAVSGAGFGGGGAAVGGRGGRGGARASVTVAGRVVGTDSIATLVGNLYPELFRDSVKTEHLLVAIALDTLGNVLYSKQVSAATVTNTRGHELLVELFPDLARYQSLAGGWTSGPVSLRGRPTKTFAIIFGVYARS